MALKFLNKKGWHTGSLRNIENVWKAEQKEEAEQRKLDELRKQIEEERERAEFRQLQEQAGLVPRQERLDFLYDSGLAVGKGSTEFRAAEVLPGTQPESSASKQALVPGALFEDKPQSANDAWRKLHTDPLLLIRQREQEALARIKNNPVQMAMIRKSVEKKKQPKEEKRSSKKHKHHKKTKHNKYASDKDQSDSEGYLSDEKDNKKRYQHENDYRKKSKHIKRPSEIQSDREGHMSDHEKKRKRHVHLREGDSYDRSKQPKSSDSDISAEEERRERHHNKGLNYNVKSKHKSSAERDPYIQRNLNQRKEDRTSMHHDGNYRGRAAENQPRKTMDILDSRDETHHKHRPSYAPKLSAEEKAARAREMQDDAELHEEQRWKRLKKASEADAQEAVKNVSSSGSRNFLDATRKSVFGTEKGGSSTIEESVRRRTHYLQGRSAHEGNAFRR